MYMMVRSFFGLGFGAWLLAGVLCWGACQECSDCPAPPEGFRFQVVDFLGRDLVKSSRARYAIDDVSMSFEALGKSYPVILDADTFQTARVIFEAPFAADILQNGAAYLLIHLGDKTDTIRPHISKIESYCCNYVIYNFSLMNADTMKRSTTDDFVFLVRK
ncbi:MAG: hypothetical protein RIS47_1594 [Bacteroidota bacterium]|jgi:hypothetical protein